MFQLIEKNIRIIFFILSSIFLTIFFLSFKNISPYSIDWLFSGGDITTHYLGWCYFNDDIWRFPFGLNPNYGGINNSIVYSDSIPLLAFIFKILNFLFIKDFNYFSFWVFICFFFQFFFSYKLVYSFTKNNLYSIICSIFFAISPVFLQKMAYVFSHGAHFLIIAALYILNIKDDKKTFIYWLILATFSILINFYFFLIISLIFFFNQIKDFLFKKKYYLFIKSNLIYLLSSLLVMYSVGYFSISAINSIGGGWAYYKANLLTFFDPVQVANNLGTSTTGFYSWSLFLKDIPSYPGEFSGFAYLGLGVIILLIISLFYILKIFFLNKIIIVNKIYLYVFAFFFLLSLSTTIDLGHINIIDLKISKYLAGLLGIFRGGGRFIWPAYYLLLLFVFFIIYKNNSFKNTLFLIITCLAIQLIDTAPGLSQLRNGKFFLNKNNPSFKNINFEKFSNAESIKSTYEKNYHPDHYFVGQFACKNKIKTNIYYLARYDRFLTSSNRYKIYDELVSKNISNNLYLVSDEFNHILDFKDRFKNTDIGFFYVNSRWFFQNKKRKNMNAQDLKDFEEIKFSLFTEKKIIDGNSKEFFGIGWFYDPSNKFLWTDGNVSSFLAKINKESISKKIIFKIDKYSLNKENVILEIFVNDNFLKVEKLKKNITDSFEIDLSKLNIDLNVNNLNLRVDFKYQDLLSEFEKKKNINGNKRAFRLLSVILQ